MKPVIHDYHPDEPGPVETALYWVFIALILAVPVLLVVLIAKAAALGS